MSANNSEKEEKPQQDVPEYNQNEIKDPQEEASKENILDRHNEETKKIFVKNIPYNVDDTELNGFFSTYGKVIKAEVIKRGDGSSSGAGFVEFVDVEDKRKVLGMNVGSLILKERTLEVKEARPEMDYSKTLYVGNLSYKTTEESLKKFFTDFCQDLKGNFKVSIQTQPNGKAKGYAYVEFENEEDITNALKINGEKLDDRNLTVEMKKFRGMGGPRGRSRGRFQRGIGRRGGFANRRYDYGRENYYRGNRGRSRSRSHDRSRERERSRERDRDKRRGDRDRGERDRYRDNRDRERNRDDRRDRDHGERDRGDRGERDRGERDRGDRDKIRGDRDRSRERRHMNMDRNQP